MDYRQPLVDLVDAIDRTAIAKEPAGTTALGPVLIELGILLHALGEFGAGLQATDLAHQLRAREEAIADVDEVTSTLEDLLVLVGSKLASSPASGEVRTWIEQLEGRSFVLVPEGMEADTATGVLAASMKRRLRSGHKGS